MHPSQPRRRVIRSGSSSEPPPPPLPPRAARRYYRYIASEAARPTRKGVANRGAPCNRPACYRKHSGWGRERRRRHVALSLRARQSSARVRRALARRERGKGRGEEEGALKGALTWLTTSRPIFSFPLSLILSVSSYYRSYLQCYYRVRSFFGRALYMTKILIFLFF